MSLLDDLLVGFDEALDWPVDDAGEPEEGSFQSGPHHTPPSLEPTA